MADPVDLEAAVRAGVISPAQKAALEARSPPTADRDRDTVGPDDERFRFLNGFNDVFLTLGVLLVTGAFLSRWSPASGTFPVVLVVGAAVLWAISEVLVARKKAVLPGIAAVLCIGLLVSIAAGQWAVQHGFEGIKQGRQAWSDTPFLVWIIAVGTGWTAVLLYYIRFRLPFALLPLGYGAMATAMLALLYWLGFDRLEQIGFERTYTIFNATALALGLIAFAIAMAFDTSDPARITRRADCGFWLHLAAAPFIVHPVVSMLGQQDSAAAALVTILLVALLGLVAVIVDRRALLVSSLTYFGLAIGYFLRATSVRSVAGVDPAITTTLALLGAFVILMGLGWHPLRRLILRPFSGQAWLTKLPPVIA